jgi:Na+-transporting NADH:ubiquinone oxidoreductase subunit F
MTEITLGVVFFTAIVLVLALIVLAARRFLVPAGECEISINGRTKVTASIGQRLLDVLTGEGILLPSACGGAGTCGLCKARIVEGGGDPRPQDLALLSRKETARGVRLACQVPVLSPMSVEVEDIYFGVKSWRCTVGSVRNVATFIKEIVFNLPEGEQIDCRPGSFIQVTCPPYQLDFSVLDIDKAFREVWDRSALWSLRASTTDPVTRAYSMANRPGHNREISLVVRVALPPPGNRNIPPGIVSSWLFSLKVGDTADLAGPFGSFTVESTDNEAIFIGGGVGMAPLFAQILELLESQKSSRRISYWYGARSKSELFYDDEFERLQAEYENFSWHVVLSEPKAQDKWQGHTGFIHNVIYDEYLKHHSTPEECEYYLCGPPLMVKAVLAMLDSLGVTQENIYYDDFGGQ